MVARLRFEVNDARAELVPISGADPVVRVSIGHVCKPSSSSPHADDGLTGTRNAEGMRRPCSTQLLREAVLKTSQLRGSATQAHVHAQLSMCLWRTFADGSNDRARDSFDEYLTTRGACDELSTESPNRRAAERQSQGGRAWLADRAYLAAAKQLLRRCEVSFDPAVEVQGSPSLRAEFPAEVR